MAPASPPPRTIELAQVLARPSMKAIELWLEVVPEPVEREAQVADLDAGQLTTLGDVLDAETGEELVSTLEPHAAGDLLVALPLATAGTVLDALNTDIAADVLRELDAQKRERLLGAVPAGQAAVLRGLLAWPEHSAAAHMVPDLLTVEQMRPPQAPSTDSASRMRAAAPTRSRAGTSTSSMVPAGFRGWWRSGRSCWRPPARASPSSWTTTSSRSDRSMIPRSPRARCSTSACSRSRS